MAATFKSPRSHPAAKLSLRARLKDVALQAGVASSTVSAILANRPHCYASEDTRQRVMEAAQRLNYQPNTISRALMGQQTYTIGLILRDLSGPTLKIENIAAIERLMQAEGYRVLLAAHENNTRREENLIRSFLGQHVDGFILEQCWSRDNEGLFARMIEAEMPMVSVDPPQPIDCDQVSVDRRAGAGLLVRHLIQTGRKRFLFVIENPRHPFGAAKIAGHRDALIEAGLDPDRQLWLSDAVEEGAPEEAYPLTAVKLVGEAIRAGHTFDAVVASSDSLAVGAMRSLSKAGLRVPEDVAVAGYHDQPLSASLPVSLTTVRRPPDIDRNVFDLLMAQIRRGDSDDEPRPAPQTILHAPTLVPRESTGFASEADVGSAASQT